jgi:hypothetical protein
VAPAAPPTPSAPIIVIVSLDTTTAQANITAGARGAVPAFYQTPESDLAAMVAVAIANAKAVTPDYITAPTAATDDEDDDAPQVPRPSAKPAKPASAKPAPKPAKPTKPPKGQGVAVSFFDAPVTISQTPVEQTTPTEP